MCLPLVATLLVCLGSIPLTPLRGNWSPGAILLWNFICTDWFQPWCPWQGCSAVVSSEVSLSISCNVSCLFCLHSSHLFFPPGAVFWGGGGSQWEGSSRRSGVRCQHRTVHLGLVPGPGCSPLQGRAFKGKEVNPYKPIGVGC